MKSDEGHRARLPRFSLIVALLLLAGLGTGRMLQGCARTSKPMPAFGDSADVPALSAARPSPTRAAGAAALPLADAGAPMPSGHATRGLGPAPVLYPRDPAEWQGMLVDLTFPQVCNDTAVCGLALACKSDGHCGPCGWDDECSSGEGCVLDRCLRRANITCASRRDCGPDALCILSSFSQGARANADLRSYCQASSGGEQQVDGPAPTDEWLPAPPTPVSTQRLLDSLHQPEVP